MATQNEDLKARMMAEAERAIDQMLAAAGDPRELMLSDIERVVRTAGQRMMKQFTGGLAEVAGEQKGCEVCPGCGGKLTHKGFKERNILTETGQVRVKRPYYYCPGCRKGVIPPGPALEPE
jgi:hypothetical protein